MKMLKHLYYILNSDLSTLTENSFDSDFTTIGIITDKSSLRVTRAFLDILKVQMVNAPTLFTSFADFMNFLHYYVRMYGLPLYQKAVMIDNLTISMLQNMNVTTHTITANGTKNNQSSGTDTNSKNDTATKVSTESASNFRKFSDTPTKINPATDFVDQYTKEQEKNTDSKNLNDTINTTSGNAITYGKKDSNTYSDTKTDTLNEINFTEYNKNISKLNQTLYNEIEKIITTKLMYGLLYDIPNN